MRRNTLTGMLTSLAALKVNAAGTSAANSASGSLLLDLQVGGVGKLAVRKDGSLLLLGTSSSGVSSASSAAIRFTGSGKIELASEYSTCGIQMGGAGTLITAPVLTLGGAWVAISNDAFGNNPSYLVSEATNTLALRNGAAAQTFRVYNTYTNDSNYERAVMGFSSNVLKIGQEKLGTGTDRGTEINGGLYLNILVQGSAAIGIGGAAIGFTKNITFTDNTYDIGASGANRPRNVYVGTAIYAPTLRAASLQVDGTGGTGTFFVNAVGVDGVVRISDFSGADFNRLQLGGTANTHPAIARDGAGIKFTGAAAGSTSWIKVPPVAVSALPAAATAGVGARAFVNDATAPVFGSAVTGGGAVPVPVYSTGSAWNVG